MEMYKYYIHIYKQNNDIFELVKKYFLYNYL